VTRKEFVEMLFAFSLIVSSQIWHQHVVHVVYRSNVQICDFSKSLLGGPALLSKPVGRLFVAPASVIAVD
jgi:hypothetical protein